MAEDATIATERAKSDDAENYWLQEGFGPGGVIREIDADNYIRGLAPQFEGIKIVDCDTHFSEPPDLFTSRMPAKFKDRMP